MIPTITLPLRGSASLRLPYRPDNRDIVEDLTGRRPRWDADRKRWLIRRIDVPQLIEDITDAWGECRFLWQTTSSTARCDVRCATAKGFECRCSCGGTNHQGGLAGWIEAGASTLLQRGDQQWISRTYTKEIAA